MAAEDHALRETLASGASRIFNVAAITRKLETVRGETETFLFGHRSLNDAVFIKRPKDAASPNRSGAVQANTAEILENGALKTVTFDLTPRVEKGDIATFLYIPFDVDDIAGGGNSLDLSVYRGRAEALFHLTGFRQDEEGRAIARDRRLIELIEELPSLDPFLLRDRLETDGIKAPEAYFEISESEFQEIKKYILGKFKPITTRVVDPTSPKAAEVAEQFILKLWQGKDLDYLAPITQVFRIDPEQAGEIYYSWKGVTYYEFQYKRGQRTLLGFADWLHTKGAVPSHYVKASVRQELEAKARQVAGAFARHLKNSSEILRIYNQAYEDLFVRGGDARPFIEFLKDSSTLFWDIAASISAMNHGVAVWRQHTAKSTDGKLAADDLTRLLALLDRVIV
ncbi:hypothetical protein T8K17_03930 [Thalassobaculum sp. OXR-137]|uniref:hypothetical protein n=1 Tax=Thalassobaculum sp. OXR-137 TaxID=3100173 RepID=UPI002AC9428D|nr:hypothetical protein [Thalassobaculum sp. OXR-137]WPZ35295.1 hypothetical protein T8K17_03930 [Thalassobaculum sp. OXR-137]